MLQRLKALVRSTLDAVFNVAVKLGPRLGSILDQVDAASLPAFLRNKVLMRRAGTWASLAYQFGRVR